jgi:predicted aldo/keto reductase-like oxidoreductase
METIMRYRRFGKTGLNIPVISCGGMRFQQSWNGDDAVSSESQANVASCVRRALERGINHIETARGYGTSELQLGKVLPGLPRGDLIVQTKVNPSDNPDRFAADFETSMRLLGLDYIDLFSLHGINDAESLEHGMRCLDRALAWQREGRIRHIGFSTHGPTDIIIRAIATGAFEYVNLHWFYVFQDNWPAIVEARRQDMGVFIISPNDKGGQLYRPSDTLLALTAPLHPMVFNDLFCLSRPEVHTLSCGVSRPGDFDIHMDAVQKMDRADEWVAPILARLHDQMVRIFGRDWTETWDHGLPQWTETPGGINIPWILRLRNLALAYDMTEYARMRYNLLGNGGTWFPGNRADKLDSVDLAACLARSPNARAIPAALAEAHALLAGPEVRRLQKTE